MALREVQLAYHRSPLPDRINDFLKESDERIQTFLRDQSDGNFPGFVPSDFPEVYLHLKAIQEAASAPGPLFCEWGCGFGVVASLAALLEFEAYGIEIEEELVLQAQQLSQDFDLPVEFVTGNFVPRGGEVHCDAASGDFTWLADGGDDAHDKMGLEPRDFDVIFAYPWPSESEAIWDLFDAFASTGALLITYHGIEGLKIHRKVNAK